MTSFVPRPILYTSFDEVPAPKGASTHIEAFVTALGARFGKVILATPDQQSAPLRDFAPGVRQLVFGCAADNPLARARLFREQLFALLQRQSFGVIHFRSIFEGYPIALLKPKLHTRLVYEVNGLPSIELKYHYRDVLEDTVLLKKLEAQEDACLQAADVVLTVSAVTQQLLLSRGVPAERIQLIRNGVDPHEFPFQPPKLLSPGEPATLLYSGTFTLWQGVETAIQALPLIRQQRPAQLQLVGSGGRGRQAELKALVAELGLVDHVQFVGTVPRAELAARLHASHATVVPLAPVDRNLRQGCCPLKLLEALSAGCPVVASDLPVVREVAQPETHFAPCRPGDPKSLANAVLRVLAEPAQTHARSARGQMHVAEHFAWKTSTERLLEVYEGLGSEAEGFHAEARRGRLKGESRNDVAAGHGTRAGVVAGDSCRAG